jgi:hypothetical protein
MKKINPTMLTLADHSYWSMGDIVGAAFKDGRALMKK